MEEKADGSIRGYAANVCPVNPFRAAADDPVRGVGGTRRCAHPSDSHRETRWESVVGPKRPVTESTYSVAQVPNTVYAWMTSMRVKALNESQLAQDWFCPYCTGPYFQ